MSYQSRTLFESDIADYRSSVISYFSLTPGVFYGGSRKRYLLTARHIFAYILREELGLRFHDIAIILGLPKQDAAAKYAYEKIKNNIKEYEQDIEAIITNCKQMNSTREAVSGSNLANSSKIIESSKDIPFVFKNSKKDMQRMENIFRLWLDGSTLQEIGDSNSLTRERVRQIIDDAVKKRLEDFGRKGIKLDKSEYVKDLKSQHSLARKVKHGISIEPKVPKIVIRRWARAYDRCRECGKTVYPHASHGYCEKCFPKTSYFKEYQKTSHLRNRDKIYAKQKEYAKSYQLRPEVKEKQKQFNDKVNFGGNRELAIELAGSKCQICGMTRDEHQRTRGKDILVMHRNQSKSNSPEDLMVLCGSCFSKENFRARHERGSETAS